MILHVSKDDRFILSAISIFEKVNPQNNKYVVWKSPRKYTLPTYFIKFWINKDNYILSFPKIKNLNPNNLDSAGENNSFTTLATYGSDAFFKEIGDITQYNAIIFHSLIYNHAKILKTILKRIDIPIVWIPYGYEIHNMLPEFKKTLFQFETLKYIRKNRSGQSSNIVLLENLKAQIIKEAIKMTDICAVPILEEFVYYKTQLNLKAQFEWFSYYPIEQISEINNHILKGNNILVGNSSTPTNNHLEVFSRLKSMELDDRKIIAPLNYGNKNYAKNIAIVGKKYFGDKFQSIDEFLSLPEYNKIICTCKIAIMNHNRQQAFGTILGLIWFGLKVFLNENNSIYQYLKRIGVCVFSFEKEFDTNAFDELNHQQIQKNKQILFEEFSEKTICQRTKVLIEKIMELQK